MSRILDNLHKVLTSPLNIVSWGLCLFLLAITCLKSG